MFSPKHFFPSENISIRRGNIPIEIRNDSFFFISREASTRLWEQLEDTRGCMQFPPVYSDVVDIEEEGGRALCRGEGNKFRRVALLWSIKGLPGAFTQS